MVGRVVGEARYRLGFRRSAQFAGALDLDLPGDCRMLDRQDTPEGDALVTRAEPVVFVSRSIPLPSGRIAQVS